MHNPIPNKIAILIANAKEFEQVEEYRLSQEFDRSNGIARMQFPCVMTIEKNHHHAAIGWDDIYLPGYQVIPFNEFINSSAMGQHL